LIKASNSFIIRLTPQNGWFKFLEILKAKWHLKVNLKKTKIVTFNNSDRKCKHLFQYDDSVIENVSNYSYLGRLVKQDRLHKEDKKIL
jgi:hypothetical protein